MYHFLLSLFYSNEDSRRKKRIYRPGFSVLFFILLGFVSMLFTGCQFFNSSVPEYINKYANEAGLHKVEFSGSSDVKSTGMADHIILPGAAESVLVFSMWNPKKINLDIKIYKYNFPDARWDTEPLLSLDASPRSDGDGTYTLEYNYSAAPDKFYLGIKDANIKEKYLFRAEISERGGANRNFGSMDTPLIHCNIKPVTPTISPVPVAFIDGEGLVASWTVDDCKNLDDYKNVTSMQINFRQIRSGTIPRSAYTRTYIRNNTVWEATNGNPGVLDFFGKNEGGTFQAKMPVATENSNFSHLETAVPCAQFQIILFNELGQASDPACTPGYDDEDLSTVYVGGPGAADTNNGFYSNLPLATIEKALEYIVGMENPKIVLMGDLNKGNSSDKSSVNPNNIDTDSFESIKGFSGPKLTILGNGKMIDASATNLRGFYIEYDGVLTIEGLTIKNGNITGKNGGGIYYEGTGELILGNGVNILDNTAGDSGGGIYIDGGGTCRINDGTVIAKNTAYGTGNDSGGGGIYLKSGTLRISGGTIGDTGGVGNTASRQGGGIHVNGDRAVFEMIRGDIVWNKTTGSVSGDGGGVFVGRGIFNMSGGYIKSNTAEISGGGVYVRDYGLFYISGGSIINNEAKSVTFGGGGVAVADGKEISPQSGYGARFVMTGGEIRYNTASDTNTNNNGGGGGVLVYAKIDTRTNFEMSGGTISDNWTAGSRHGGGVYIAGYGTGIANMVLSGNAVIENNGKDSSTITTSLGGGISITNNGILTMKGGTIKSNNVKDNGGGVYVDGGTFTMEGGTISSNSAGQEGGGVYVKDDGTNSFTMRGKARVDTNNVIYLRKYLGIVRAITVGSFTPGSDFIAKIKPESPSTAGDTVINTSSLPDGKMTEALKNRFELDAPGYTLGLDGKLQNQ